MLSARTVQWLESVGVIYQAGTKPLGKGTYGTVYPGTLYIDGQPMNVAIKLTDDIHSDSEAQEFATAAELYDLMGRQAIGPHVFVSQRVHTQGVVVMQRYDMSLRSLMRDARFTGGSAMADSVSHQIQDLLERMAAKGVYCYDLKLGNFVVNVDWSMHAVEVRVIDFDDTFCVAGSKHLSETERALVMKAVAATVLNFVAQRDFAARNVWFLHDFLGSNDYEHTLWALLRKKRLEHVRYTVQHYMEKMDLKMVVHAMRTLMDLGYTRVRAAELALTRASYETSDEGKAVYLKHFDPPAAPVAVSQAAAAAMASAEAAAAAAEAAAEAAAAHVAAAQMPAARGPSPASEQWLHWADADLLTLMGMPQLQPSPEAELDPVWAAIAVPRPVAHPPRPPAPPPLPPAFLPAVPLRAPPVLDVPPRKRRRLSQRRPPTAAT